MHAFTVLLALAASTLAYQVTEPSSTKGFTSVGPNTVSWDKVATDTDKFQIILTNSNRTLLPEDKQIAPSVDGEKGSYTFTTPDPIQPGDHYRINLNYVDQPNSILAQSDEFTITPGGGSIL